MLSGLQIRPLIRSNYCRCMDLHDVMYHSSRIGRIAFVATTRADGRPHSAPVGIAWVDDHLCAFVQQPSVKVTNARRDARVHFH